LNNLPIGIFDSGVGGTSIWKEIHRLMPSEQTIYLADSINAPYGPKGKQAIINLSVKNTEWLLKKRCKLIVVACNTATTNAISFLRNQYQVPFIGIEPAIKPAALHSKTKAIGVLATKGTLASHLFYTTSSLYSKGIRVIEQDGEGLVELIENGKINSLEMSSLLQFYLKPMKEANIDYLVLGCTHYPYLIPQLIKLLPKQVKIIDSGQAVARQTKAILEKEKLRMSSENVSIPLFYTNGQPQTMESLLDYLFEVHYLNF